MAGKKAEEGRVMGQLWHLPFSSRTSCPDSLVPLMPNILFEILGCWCCDV